MLRNLIRHSARRAPFNIRATTVGHRQPLRQLSTSGALAAQQFDLGANFTHSDAEGFVRQSPFADIQLPDVRIDQFVWRNVARWHDRPAIVCGNTGHTLTYAQLRDHCAALAVRLQHARLGLAAQDVIAVCLPNGADFVIACLGGLEAGLVVTPVNTMYTAAEISKQLQSSGAKLIIGTADGYALLHEAVQLTKRPITIVCARTTPDQQLPAGAVDFQQLAQPEGVDFGALVQHPVDPNSVALMPFSSGTTGLPKGVLLSHNNITANCEQFSIEFPHSATGIVQATTATFQDCVPCVLPFFHIYGFTVTLASKLALGCKIVTLDKFAPDTFLRTLVVHRGTLLHMVPPIVNFLAMHPAVEKKHLGSIRHAMSGASPLSTVEAQRFLAKVDRPDASFMQAFGMTETSPICIMNISCADNYDSSGGLTPNTEAKIIDASGASDASTAASLIGLGPNQSGELLIRGPQRMLGYLNNPTANAETIIEGGWLRTGDIAHYDEQGYFYVTERLKELIKVKGFQVAPAELEAVLRQHPLVADVAIVGVANEASGEAPMAVVVRRSEQVTAVELQEFVAGQVAVYKRLTGGVRFVDAIPKSTTGKILRKDVKKMFE